MEAYGYLNFIAHETHLWEKRTQAMVIADFHNILDSAWWPAVSYHTM